MPPEQIIAHTFTTQYPGIVSVIQTDIRVGHPLVNGVKVAQPPNDPNASFPSHAIWDTGATNTVITARAAQALGLMPIGKTIVNGVNSQSEENVYLVSVILPNNVGIPMVRVTECQQLSHPNDPYQCDVLLGMDIISIGDLAITNVGGQTTLSFRIPSVQRIDFNQQFTMPVLPTPAPAPIVQPQRNSFGRVDRNAQCPCGSGKKYKKCHGA